MLLDSRKGKWFYSIELTLWQLRVGILTAQMGCNRPGFFLLCNSAGRQVEKLLSEPKFAALCHGILADRPCGALEVARAHGKIAHNAAADASTIDCDVDKILEAHPQSSGLSVAFTRILAPWLCEKHSGRLFNSHFSLLPAFAARHGVDWTTDHTPPMRIFERAMQYGVKFIGNTIHVMDPHVDGGQPVIQSVMPVPDTASQETIRQRLFVQECKTILQFAKWWSDQRVRQVAGHLHIDGARYDSYEFAPMLEEDWIRNFA